MITGRVNEFREPIVTLSARDKSGNLHHFPATVDTGLTDYATLAPDVIAMLQLVVTETRFFVLGDGEAVELPLYAVVIHWGGEDKECVVVSADDDPLIGMEMLEGFTLFIDATVDGEVRIERRP